MYVNCHATLKLVLDLIGFVFLDFISISARVDSREEASRNIKLSRESCMVQVAKVMVAREGERINLGICNRTRKSKLT